jgi:hypothetical protein
MTEPPIACTLTAAELPRRLAKLHALGADALLSVQRGDTSATLRFRPSAATRAELEAVVEAEARCCAFLTLRLRDQPDAIVLTIASPHGGAPVVGALVDAFKDATA